MALVARFRAWRNRPARTPAQKRTLWRRILLVWIVGFTALAIGGIVSVRHLANEGNEAHHALCVFRADLEARLAASEEFLRLNPQGFPGFSNAAIASTIAQRRATIEALGSLECP